MQGVLGVAHRAEHPVAMRVHLPVRRGHEMLERALVAAAGRRLQIALVRCRMYQ
jgi:hypothetical protein